MDQGAAIISLKLVENGKFQEEAISNLLLSPGPAPGATGTRNLSDNLSDLKAQVAANQKGIILVNELIEQYSLAVVQVSEPFSHVTQHTTHTCETSATYSARVS